jgi:hypothetical protein
MATVGGFLAAIAAAQSRPIGIDYHPATGTAPASTRGSAPATTLAATSQPAAIAADNILKAFPANAGVLPSRSDARHFTVEGRIRDIRSDIAGTNPAAGGSPEIRIVLVGRAQGDDVAVHFTCHMDPSAADAVADLKVDQFIRLTGTIGTLAPSFDRIDLKGCHDLTVTGPLNAGDQLPGLWRCSSVMQDGAGLRKENQAKGVKNDETPNADFISSLHLDVEFKADGNLAAELRDKDQLVKKVAGKWSVLSDKPDEARLRLTIPGGTPQEVVATISDHTLKLSMPGFGDKFILPDTSFQKIIGSEFATDPKTLKDQALRWITANSNNSPNAQSALKFTADHIDASQANHMMFGVMFGSAFTRRGKTTTLVGAYGRLLILEYSDAESQLNAAMKNNANSMIFPGNGTPMVPEIKIEALNIDNRNAMDPSKPITGKITLRNMRRPLTAQYAVMMCVPGAGAIMILPRAPGPDPETYPFSLGPVPASAFNPRVAIFSIARAGKANDPASGDGVTRIISEPAAVLLDMAK